MTRAFSVAVLVASISSALCQGCTTSSSRVAGSNGSAGSRTGSGGSGGSSDSAGSGGSGGSSGSGGASGTGGTGGSSDSGGSSGTPGSGVLRDSGISVDSGGSTDVRSGDSAAVGCNGDQLCDDFEGPAPGTSGSAWTIIKNGYVVETVTTQAHSGTHSVHVIATGNGGYGYIEETKTFPATDWWGRAFLRIQAPSGGHEVFAGADTNVSEPSGDQVRFLNNLGGGKVSTNRRVDDHGGTSSTSIPMGSWFCYEWHETPTALSIFLDGKALTDVDQAWTEPTFVSLVLGFERFGGGTPGDIWIDDVAVNSAQIGCN
jgi:hypothetical protein